jgi:hypothetical protein
MSCAIGTRRLVALEIAPSRCLRGNRTSFPPAPAAFLIFLPLKPAGVEKNNRGGVYGAISPPIALQPPPRPPLDLMHEPRRARVKGVTIAHHEEVGGGILLFPWTL